MRTVLVIIALSCLGGCLRRDGSTLDVLDVHQRRRIEFDGRTINVIALDGTSDSGKSVWRRELTAAERSFLAERINAPSLRGLNEDYRSDIWDGFSLGFTISQRGRPPFGVGVENFPVPELVRLGDAVDVLLPDEHRINYRAMADEQESDR